MRELNPDRIDAEKTRSGAVKPQASDAEPHDRLESRVPDEEALFGGDPGPRLFGEGSYAEGGSNQEGNWREREMPPHGHYGGFSDAGGYGATELLGEPGFGATGASPEIPDTGDKLSARSQKREDESHR